MALPHQVTDPALQIPEFTVYKTDTGWRAESTHEPRTAIEHDDWVELLYLCTTARVAREMRALFGKHPQ